MSCRNICRLSSRQPLTFDPFTPPAGVPGVKPERYEEGLAAKHCALSLVGEPIMYPEINSFLRLLHAKRISSFLVTNAQFPQEIRWGRH